MHGRPGASVMRGFLRTHQAIPGTGKSIQIQIQKCIQPYIRMQASDDEYQETGAQKTTFERRMKRSAPCVRPSSSYSFLETLARAHPKPMVHLLATEVGFLLTSTLTLRKGPAHAMHQSRFSIEMGVVGVHGYKFEHKEGICRR